MAVWPLNSLIPLEGEENRARSPVVFAGIVCILMAVTAGGFRSPWKYTSIHTLIVRNSKGGMAGLSFPPSDPARAGAERYKKIKNPVSEAKNEIFDLAVHGASFLSLSPQAATRQLDSVSYDLVRADQFSVGRSSRGQYALPPNKSRSR
jgi:hypothetical protein